MNKILFIDDEVDILEGYRQIFSKGKTPAACMTGRK